MKLWILVFCVGFAVCAAKTGSAARTAEEIKDLRIENKLLLKELEKNAAAAEEHLQATEERHKTATAQQRAKIEELRGQLQESRRLEAKRQKDGSKVSSANGAVPRNSTLMADPVEGKFCPGKTLQKFSFKKSWPDARAYCQQHGGDLASLPVQSELLSAQEKIGTNPLTLIWLGGRCLGNGKECSKKTATKPWKWLDGSVIPLHSHNWVQPNEPAAGVNYCLGSYAVPTSVEMLYATSCTSKYPFVCEFSKEAPLKC